MTCPYLLIIALATTSCHPSLDDALQHGMAAHLDGAESVVVEYVRRGRRLEIREVPEGLRGLLMGGRDERYDRGGRDGSR